MKVFDWLKMKDMRAVLSLIEQIEPRQRRYYE
jgi:hypothetical protein